MKARLIVSLVIALVLVAVLAAPAMAVEQTAPASVTVNEFISITLEDPGDAGINFGNVNPPATGTTTYGDVAQSDGTPAVGVTVDTGTNVDVDISIKGALTSGTLTLSNWKYSLTFAGAKTSIPAAYGTADYTNVTADTTESYYHWVDIPAGTAAGSHQITVTYKAIKS